MALTENSSTAQFISQQLAAGKEANSLINEKSPYLLQHAFNPVHWLPWGDEAFLRAQRQDKPIFLSIGYSTCHWCHVMAHESFADEAVAAFLNEHFIAIKVDREERPDIDQIYMAATSAISGSSGWPMSVFLLADRSPFYAGTYFPPRPVHGRPGFLDLLRQINGLWQKDRGALVSNGQAVMARLKAAEAGPKGPVKKLSEEILHLCCEQAAQSFDPSHGGFGPAPKFPRPAIFDLLLRYDAWRENGQARQMVLFSLGKMGQGGIYDQLGGGFHRYSVDSRWRVPHFEKMLYDQGQLASLYLAAFQVSGDPSFRRLGTEILDYVLREMTDGAGGFYSAEDADSESHGSDGSRQGEGLFYLWQEAEIVKLLGAEVGAITNFYYGVKAGGNVSPDPLAEFAGKNIPYVAHDLAETARKFGKGEGEIAEVLATARQSLFRARSRRPRPHLDDKIITAWNGLMISAMARGFQVTGEEKYLDAADKCAAFVEKNLISQDGKSLLRRFRAGEARFPGQLEDYAFFGQGLLDLYSAGFNHHWLELAAVITGQQIELFGAGENGAFFHSPADAEDILVRMRTSYDGAEPAGNGVAALNLLRLGAILANEQWRERALATISFFAGELKSQPFGCPTLAAAYALWRQPPRQLVIAGEPEAADTRELIRTCHRFYLPNTVLLLADNGPGQRYLAQGLPHLAQMTTTTGGRATAYLCDNFSCDEPVTSPDELAQLLGSLGR
ncbi:MAG: thioredoxin domain-containing protein [Thermodesulfobacteriota bacterium]